MPGWSSKRSIYLFLSAIIDQAKPIDSAAWLGLDSGRYHPENIRVKITGDYSPEDSMKMIGWDSIYMDAAITYHKDVYHLLKYPTDQDRNNKTTKK